ncbi:MAG: NAD(P)-dependent oxidoreductase [Pusillimonas sp.]
MSVAVGFIGLGNMGGRMSVRLVREKYPVHVFDTNAQASERAASEGAIARTSPKEVADHSEWVCLSLPTPAIVRQALLGPDGVVRGGKVRQVIDFSTIGPQAAIALAKELAGHGIEYIDAPVSGGVSGAQKGTLAVMVSCRQETYDMLQPMLSIMGKIFYVGDRAGQAQTVKLANNLLSMTALAVSSEAMVMGAKVGIDPQLMLDAINAGSGRNSATQEKFSRSILPGTFDFGFTTGLAYKDVKLCVDEAEQLGVPMFVGAAVRELYAVSQATQGEESDFTAVCRVIEGWAGSVVRQKQ